jgi:hypothetical protein
MTIYGAGKLGNVGRPRFTRRRVAASPIVKMLKLLKTLTCETHPLGSFPAVLLKGAHLSAGLVSILGAGKLGCLGAAAGAK